VQRRSAETFKEVLLAAVEKKGTSEIVVLSKRSTLLGIVDPTLREQNKDVCSSAKKIFNNTCCDNSVSACQVYLRAHKLVLTFFRF